MLGDSEEDGPNSRGTSYHVSVRLSAQASSWLSTELSLQLASGLGVRGLTAAICQQVTERCPKYVQILSSAASERLQRELLLWLLLLLILHLAPVIIF